MKHSMNLMPLGDMTNISGATQSRTLKFTVRVHLNFPKMSRSVQNQLISYADGYRMLLSRV